MTLGLEVFSDESWAGECADRFKRFMSDHPSPRVCLPTGVTMTPFYREVAEKVDLSGATIFLLDEFGGLPVDDPGRCETMLRRELLDLAKGEPGLLVPDVDARDLGAEAKRYDDRIAEEGLDLAVLGLGSNGHIGMNEPGSGPESPTRVVALDSSTTDHAREAYGATSSPTWGMTVGLAQLLASRKVWLLVTGRHKASILEATLTGPIGSDVPATLLRDHPNAKVLADTSAATRL